MGCVGSSDTPSEVPMKYMWVAESILSEERRDFRPRSEVLTTDLTSAESILLDVTWDFRHWSEVPILDRKFRYFENYPNKRWFRDEF